MLTSAIDKVTNRRVVQTKSAFRIGSLQDSLKVYRITKLRVEDRHRKAEFLGAVFFLKRLIDSTNELKRLGTRQIATNGIGLEFVNRFLAFSECLKLHKQKTG